MKWALNGQELWNQTIKKHQFPLQNGEFVDCGSIIWPHGTFPYIPSPGVISNEYPVHGDGFRAGKIEWDALALALYLLRPERQNKRDDLTIHMVELGASAAPWTLTFLKLLLQQTTYIFEGLAVEAGDVKKLTKYFWRSNQMNFTVRRLRSGFKFKNKRYNVSFVRGIASNRNENVYFPKVDISKDNGATSAINLADLDKRGVEGFDRLKAIDTFDLLENKKNISFLHMDIQGAEVDLILDKRFSNLAERIDVLMIGTHSALADKIALEIDGRFNLVLLDFNPMKPSGPNGEWPVDGEYLFINGGYIAQLESEGILSKT